MTTTSSTSESPSQTITRLFTALNSLQPPPPLPTPSITAPAPPNILHRLTNPSATAARSILLTLHLLFPHDFLPALDLLDRGLVNRFTTPPPPQTDTSATEANTSTAPSTSTVPPRPTTPPAQEVFYIQSASAQTESHASRGGRAGEGGGGGSAAQGGRFRNAMARGKATDTFYEVRLDAWNCSCAAFAFAGYVLLGDGEGATNAGGADAATAATEGVGVEGRRCGSGGAGPAPRGGDADEVGGRSGGGGGGGAEDVEAVEAGTGKGGWGGEFRFGGTTVEGGIAPVCKHILAAAMAKNIPDFAMPLGREGREWRREVGVKELAGWGAGWGDRG